MSEKQLKNVSWFALFGLVTILTPFLWALNDPRFLTVILPTHVVEAVMFIVLGALLSDQYLPPGLTKKKQEAMSALMVLLWVLIQAWVLMNPTANWSVFNLHTLVFWVLAAGQVYLGYSFFIGKELSKELSFIKINWGTGISLSLLTLTAVVKIVLTLLNIDLATTALTTPLIDILWGTAVLLMALGYLLPERGYKTFDVVYLQPVGLIIAVFVAFTMSQSGMALLAFI